MKFRPVEALVIEDKRPVIDYPVVDAHVHLVRDAEQQRRVFPMADAAPIGGYKYHPGAIDEVMRFYGMSHVVFLNVMATQRMVEAHTGTGSPTKVTRPIANTAVDKPEARIRAAVERFNAWACNTHQDNPALAPCVFADFAIFGPDTIAEVERGVAAGAVGVKMHPEFTRVQPNDRMLWGFYDRVVELGVPIVSDSGASLWDPADYGRPALFADVLRAFPKLTLVLAHLGSAYWDERVSLARNFPNVHFDTAGGFSNEGHAARGGRRALAEEDALRVIRAVGVDRVMFGSDAPAWDAGWQLLQIARLGLQPAELQAILADNALRVYRLSRASRLRVAPGNA